MKVIGQLAALVVIAAFVSASSPVRAAEPGPRRTSAPGPVLVEMGGWQIFARTAEATPTGLRFDEVRARRVQPAAHGAWALATDRLDVALQAGPDGPVRWMWARGHVRLGGPDDLYVMADQALGLAPRRSWSLIGAHARPSVVGDGWRLRAHRIEVDLDGAHVRLWHVGQRPRE